MWFTRGRFWGHTCYHRTSWNLSTFAPLDAPVTILVHRLAIFFRAHVLPLRSRSVFLLTWTCILWLSLSSCHFSTGGVCEILSSPIQFCEIRQNNEHQRYVSSWVWTFVNSWSPLYSGIVSSNVTKIIIFIIYTCYCARPLLFTR